MSTSVGKILSEVLKLPSEPRAFVADAGQSWGEVFKDLIGAAEGLPDDMAENHDHFIRGAPKREVAPW